MHRRSRSRSPIGRKGWPPGGKGDYGGWQWHGGHKGGGWHGGWQCPYDEIPIGSHPDIARQIFEAGMAAAHSQMGLSPLTSDALRGDLPQDQAGPQPQGRQVAGQPFPGVGVGEPPGPREPTLSPPPEGPSPSDDGLWYQCHYWPFGLSGQSDCEGWSTTWFKGSAKTRWCCDACNAYHNHIISGVGQGLQGGGGKGGQGWQGGGGYGGYSATMLRT